MNGWLADKKGGQQRLLAPDRTKPRGVPGLGGRAAVQSARGASGARPDGPPRRSRGSGAGAGKLHRHPQQQPRWSRELAPPAIEIAVVSPEPAVEAEVATGTRLEPVAEAEVGAEAKTEAVAAVRANVETVTEAETEWLPLSVAGIEPVAGSGDANRRSRTG